MKYDKERREIILSRELNELDSFAIKFTEIVEKYVDYAIISGYISILLGRSRATEDIDIFIKRIPVDIFSKLYTDLEKAGFWCLNAENVDEIYSYLNDGLAVRFSKEGTPVPNFEVKFPKREIDDGTFNDFITVILPGAKLKISSLERHIAFKRYYLESDKDIEDALHVEGLFGQEIDYSKVNKFREIIDRIKEDERNKHGK